MKTINDYAELVKEKHALNKTIAPVETDLTDASREYHIGEQFIINGGLFKAKTEIAQHDALVLNTNYEPADNLTEQIKNAGGGTGTDPRLDVFENNIASVETDETDASKEYQVGKQLILNNILYDVIAPISKHDVITTTGSGANIAPADPISSQFQTLTNQKLDTKVINLADMVEYNNDLAMLPDGVFFVSSTVFSSNTIANKPFESSSGALVISKRLPTNKAKIMTVEPFVRTFPAYTGYGYPENDDWNWDSHVKTSNPNLLDNPWFTVNQRGISGAVLTAYGFDRWWGIYDYDSTNKCLKFSALSQYVIQNFESDFKEKLDDKTVTLSVLYADGTIEKGTGVYHAVNSTYVTIFSGRVFCQISPEGLFALTANEVCSIKACKMELGEVSTLAMDTAPNYATELLKCQRYFNRIGHASEYVGVGVGQAWNDNTACIHVPLSVPMRAIPSVTQSGSAYANLRNQQTVVGTVNSYTVDGAGQNEIMLRLGTSNTPLTAGLVYEAFLAGGRYIDLSADL